MFEFLKRLFKGKENAASSTPPSGPDPVAVYAITTNSGEPKTTEEKAHDPTAQWEEASDDISDSDGDFDID